MHTVWLPICSNVAPKYLPVSRRQVTYSDVFSMCSFPTFWIHAHTWIHSRYMCGIRSTPYTPDTSTIHDHRDIIAILRDTPRHIANTCTTHSSSPRPARGVAPAACSGSGGPCCYRGQPFRLSASVRIGSVRVCPFTGL